MNLVRLESVKSQLLHKEILFVLSLLIQSVLSALSVHFSTKTDCVSWLILYARNSTRLQANAQNATQATLSKKENVKSTLLTQWAILSVLSSIITYAGDVQQDIISKRTENAQPLTHCAPHSVRWMDVASAVSSDTWLNQDFAFQNQKKPGTPTALYSTKTILASNAQKDSSSVQNYKTVNLRILCARPLTKMELVHHATLDMLFKVWPVYWMLMPSQVSVPSLLRIFVSDAPQGRSWTNSESVKRSVRTAGLTMILMGNVWAATQDLPLDQENASRTRFRADARNLTATISALSVLLVSTWTQINNASKSTLNAQNSTSPPTSVKDVTAGTLYWKAAAKYQKSMSNSK